jgi:hypothetical protein
MKSCDDPDRGESCLLLDPWGNPYAFVGDDVNGWSGT